jgi:pimeloyl-ACP methyl ester carboxylesterase
MSGLGPARAMAQDRTVGVEVMTRRSTAIMGRRVNYWEGNPNLPRTLILLHGFRGDHEGLAAMAGRLNGYRLILPDLPGYGESEPLRTQHTIKGYVTWLDEFIARLDTDCFVVVGHSYSGSIALIHAAEGAHKPASTISVSPATARRGPPGWITTWYYQIGGLLSERWRKRWLTSRVVDRVAGWLLLRTAKGEVRKNIIEHRAKVLPTLNSHVIIEQYMSLLDIELELYAGVIKIPTLIVAGARDMIVPFNRLRKLVALIPLGTIEIVYDQGHLAPLERPAETASIIERFLDRSLAESATGNGQ